MKSDVSGDREIVLAAENGWCGRCHAKDGTCDYHVACGVMENMF